MIIICFSWTFSVCVHYSEKHQKYGIFRFWISFFIILCLYHLDHYNLNFNRTESILWVAVILALAQKDIWTSYISWSCAFPFNISLPYNLMELFIHFSLCSFRSINFKRESRPFGLPQDFVWVFRCNIFFNLHLWVLIRIRLKKFKDLVNINF
jgi:hypothetical protein